MLALPAKGHLLHTTDYVTKSWGPEILPEGVEYVHLFMPEFWKHHASKLRPFELVRVRAADGSFDVQLVVVAASSGGVVVELWPKMPSLAESEAADAERAAPLEIREIGGQPVPRVEHGKTTKWRVIGIDGNEVSRGHESKAAASVALDKYVMGLGKVMAA